jgi:hypothetical protein
MIGPDLVTPGVPDEAMPELKSRLEEWRPTESDIKRCCLPILMIWAYRGEAPSIAFKTQTRATARCNGFELLLTIVYVPYVFFAG